MCSHREPRSCLKRSDPRKSETVYPAEGSRAHGTRVIFDLRQAKRSHCFPDAAAFDPAAPVPGALADCNCSGLPQHRDPQPPCMGTDAACRQDQRERIRRRTCGPVSEIGWR